MRVFFMMTSRYGHRDRPSNSSRRESNTMETRTPHTEKVRKLGLIHLLLLDQSTLLSAYLVGIHKYHLSWLVILKWRSKQHRNWERNNEPRAKRPCYFYHRRNPIDNYFNLWIDRKHSFNSGFDKEHQASQFFGIYRTNRTSFLAKIILHVRNALFTFHTIHTKV